MNKKLIDVLNEHKDSEGKYDIFAVLLLVCAMEQVINYVFYKLEIDEKLLKEKKK